MKGFAKFGHPGRLAFFSIALLGGALAMLVACSKDDCQSTASCAGATAERADGSTTADGSNTPVGPLTVTLTAPPTTAYAIQGAKTEIAIGIVRGARVGAFTIAASGLPEGVVVAPVEVSADAMMVNVVVDVPATQAQGLLDGIKLSAFAGDAAPSLGDVALPIFVRGPSGSLDTTFGRVTGTFAAGTFVTATAQSDGKIVAALQGVDPNPPGAAVRFLADGGLDPSFGDAGASVTEGDVPRKILVDGKGRVVVVVAGGIVMLTSNGAPDPTYADAGVAELYVPLVGEATADGAQGPAGTLFLTTLVGGGPSDPNAAYLNRISPAGSEDLTYANSIGSVLIRGQAAPPKWLGGAALAVAPDGTAFVGYAAKDAGPEGAVTTVSPAGQVGTTATFLCGTAAQAAIDRGTDGKVAVVAGPTTFGSPVCVHHYTSTLDSDVTFAGTGGTVAFGGRNAFPTSVRELADGAVLVAGIAQTPGNQHDEVILERFLADGTIDASYGVGGLVEVPAESALDTTQASMVGAFIQADGSVIAVGTSLPLHGQTRIFRLWP